MSSQNPYARYRQAQVEGAPKLKLIVMLYDGAIRFLRQSIPPMVAGDYDEKVVYINKAVAIILHLTATLNYSHVSDLSVDLCKTYEVLLQRIVEGTTKNDPAIIEEVAVHLFELRQAWKTVADDIEAEKTEPTPLPPNRISGFSLAA
jgi:flagellar protein FliS